MSSDALLQGGEGTMSEDWLQLMKRGEFEAAWRLHDRLGAAIPDDEWRRPRHEQRIWDGSPLDGRRVLVRCYHGLGDTIQFIRYLPAVCRIAREVTAWVQPTLIPLLADTPGFGRLLPLHDGTPDVEFDVEVEVMELPRVFRSTLATIPRDVPYIRVPRPAGGAATRRIGIAWTAGDWDLRRSMPLSALRPVTSLEGFEFIPLRPLHSEAERACFTYRPQPLPLESLAQVMAGCSAIVSVDTMAAHLAGALGLRTHLLLHADADWRWMIDRSDSPWYPTATLYRQPRPGDWSAVVEALRNGLLTEETGQ